MIKVLLDTDIGTDVDDAVALAYLLAHPDCELLGITTVTGEAAKRASLASVLCRAAGKDVPIYPGAEQPMRGEQRQLAAQQATVLPNWPHATEFPTGRAVDFMAETIAAHPGEVVLLTIGPLTNVGMLFTAHPETAALLKALVSMGGNFGAQGTAHGHLEWNIAGDALASRIVYDAPVPMHRSLGLNVTQRVMLPAEDVRRRFTAELLRPVVDMAEIWFAGFYPFITFHDPLAAAAIFQPDLCTYQHGTVAVDSESAPGQMTWQPSAAQARQQWAVNVDIERYFEHFFSVLGC